VELRQQGSKARAALQQPESLHRRAHRCLEHVPRCAHGRMHAVIRALAGRRVPREICVLSQLEGLQPHKDLLLGVLVHDAQGQLKLLALVTGGFDDCPPQPRTGRVPRPQAGA